MHAKENREQRAVRGVMRVLISTEEARREEYLDMVEALHIRRPRLEVSAARSDDFEAQLERLQPHVVVYGGPGPARPEGRFAWVQLSPDASQPAIVWVDGRRREMHALSIEDLVSVMDEAAISCLPPQLMAAAISSVAQLD